MKLYPSVTFAHRFCMPDASKYLKAAKSKIQDLDAEIFFGDIEEAWIIIIISVFISFIVALFYCYLLEYCAPCIVWSMILGAITTLTIICILVTTKYQNMSKGSDPN
jgi:uncharacterized membrane protein YagU involved in acid resistance